MMLGTWCDYSKWQRYMDNGIKDVHRDQTEMEVINRKRP